MPETKSMAEEAMRMGEEAQEQTIKVGHEYQKAAEIGVEAASRSFGESENRLTGPCCRDDRLFQQLGLCHPHLGATHWRKSVEQAIQIQSQYAKRASPRITLPSFLNSVSWV